MLHKVVVFLPSLAGGGAERVSLALCAGLVQEGMTVRLVVGSRAGELAEAVPDGVPVDDLGASRTLAATLPLARYLRRERPDVLISAISHASVVAALAARLARLGDKLVVVHHNTTSISTRRSVRRRDRLVPLSCALAYRGAARIVAVSHGVAADLARSSHLPSPRIEVLPNPIDYARIRTLAGDDAAPPALPAGDAPLVLAVGRLEEQKGFDLLLRAVAATATPCRLALLGEGPLRAQLSALVDELGLRERVTLPGFTRNPYPYFAAADVYALSSRWEGLPTVLLEALVFPLRIVATDCRSGPREILAGVDGAELVPVEDAPALAAALDRAIGAGRLTRERDDWHEYDFPAVLKQWATLVREVAGAR